MQLLDRKRLAKLMAIQGVSQRELAHGIGWSSHTYLGRLLAGKVTTLDPDAAVRIAEFLQVGVDDLFMARSSTHPGRNVKRGGRAA